MSAGLLFRAGAGGGLLYRAGAGLLRKVLGVPCACCGTPQGVQFYLRLCACYDARDGVPGDPTPEEGDVVLCETPLEVCRFLPLVALFTPGPPGGAGSYSTRFMLSDRPSVEIIDRLGELLAAAQGDEPVTMGFPLFGAPLEPNDYGGCFSVTGGIYTDPGTTDEQRRAFLAAHGLGDEWYPLDLPPDADVPGPYGATQVLPRMAACGHAHGCGRWVSGPAYREALRCDGEATWFRFFVCSGNRGRTVIGPDGACWCIQRGPADRYTSEEVDALVAAGLALKTTSVDHVRLWRFDAQAFFYCAAAGCCWCLGHYQLGPCLTGRVYHQMPEGSTLWATADTCCGTRTGNRLRVELRQHHHRVYTDDQGRAREFLQRTEGEPRYTDNPGGNGGTLVEQDVRLRSWTDGVMDHDELTTYQVVLPPTCVLFGDVNRQCPWPGSFATHSVVTGGPGPALGNGCDPQPWLEYNGSWSDAEQILIAIQSSPWVFLFRPAIPSGGGTVATTASYFSERPGRAQVDVSQSLDEGVFGRVEASFSLVVRVLPDDSSPCGPSSCGGGGVDGMPAWMLIP
ncbi:MAG TPA: hypothetical protein VFF65_07575 [Phycisphaerales bacterium]|nr:hypothetical protein [Phycisphaerales bacterium]